jgi:hypothetical protein
MLTQIENINKRNKPIRKPKLVNNDIAYIKVSKEDVIVSCFYTRLTLKKAKKLRDWLDRAIKYLECKERTK